MWMFAKIIKWVGMYVSWFLGYVFKKATVANVFLLSLNDLWQHYRLHRAPKHRETIPRWAFFNRPPCSFHTFFSTQRFPLFFLLGWQLPKLPFLFLPQSLYPLLFCVYLFFLFHPFHSSMSTTQYSGEINRGFSPLFLTSFKTKCATTASLSENTTCFTLAVFVRTSKWRHKRARCGQAIQSITIEANRSRSRLWL